jgi:hypothetical protein
MHVSPRSSSAAARQLGLVREFELLAGCQLTAELALELKLGPALEEAVPEAAPSVAPPDGMHEGHCSAHLQRQQLQGGTMQTRFEGSSARTIAVG